MKYFVCADPHGFTTIMKDTLYAEGFREGNPNHKLVICGDIFDRGSEPVEMYQYLKGLGDQFIFVRGNHEDLFYDAYTEFKYAGYTFSWHHIHNGTDVTLNKLFNAGLIEEVAQWIDDKSVDFFETDHYVFVHGWIPSMEYDKWGNPLGAAYQENWRTSAHWSDARWYNGMRQWKFGVKVPGKTVVCGHWHCGFGNLYYHNEDEGDLKNGQCWLSDHPFIDDGIIALDACTVLTKVVNVIVLEDNYPGLQKIMENRTYNYD